jgi:hypothetical protein
MRRTATAPTVEELETFPLESSSASPRRIAGIAVAAGLVVVLIVALALGRSRTPVPPRAVAPTSPVSSSTEPVPLPRSWPHRLTLLTDSVGLGSVTALRETMDSWRARVIGHPALMVDDAVDELQDDPERLDKVVVVALGYNSLWSRHREDYDYYSSRFDREAGRLLRVIRAKGGRKIVWVTLRDPDRANVPPQGAYQYRTYAWYFPYVNERLHRLARANGDLVLADWAAISSRRGLTYDAIHLDPNGAVAYARMIRRAVLDAPFEPVPP